MSFTFLEVTNKVLREVNEVPLTTQQFLTARGLQQFAKEAVNRSFFDICGESTDWPWLQNAVLNTANTEIRKLLKSQVWYDIEDSNGVRLEADWDTFLLTEKDLESTDPDVIASIPKTVVLLDELTYEEWTERFRVKDFSQENASTPRCVIRHPSGKFGLSPAPDKDYWVEFNVSNGAVRFTLDIDVIPLPEQFINVIIARCAYYVWKFRENFDQAKLSEKEYDKALGNMERVLLSNKQDRIKAV